MPGSTGPVDSTPVFYHVNEDPVCFRTHHDTKIGKHKHQVITADCGHATESCRIAKDDFGVAGCSTCTTDNCNAGGVLKPSLAAALLAVLSVLGVNAA